MKNTKKILVTTRTREILTISHRAAEPMNRYCPTCHADVPVLDLDTAAISYCTSAGILLEGIFSGKYHTMENADGQLRVCRNSLASLED